MASSILRKAIAQMKIEGVLTDLMLQTNIQNVIVDNETGETLATELATIINDISALPTSDEVDAKITAALSDLIETAPELYETLKAIIEYIKNDEEVVDALNEAIANKVDKSTYEEAMANLNSDLDNKVDKEEGKGLSTHDLTDALYGKLVSMEGTKVEASEDNGYILVDGAEVKVYEHPTGEGFEHLPEGGTEGQILTAAGDGTGVWDDPKVCVSAGETTPEDLGANEVFFLLLDDDE